MVSAPPDRGRRLSASRVGLFGAVAYGGVLAVLLAAAFLLANSDVRGRGPFVDAVDHDVYRVRLLDRFTVYTEHPPVPFDSDLATSFVLMLVSGVALLGFALAVRLGAERRVSWFFVLTAVGATFMAFDEQCEFIDSLGYNVTALYVPDVFIYTPPALAFAWVFRRVLLASRAALAVIAVGGLVFLAAEAMDRLPDDRMESVEEKLELVAVSFWAVGVAMVALDRLAVAASGWPSAVSTASSSGLSSAAVVGTGSLVVLDGSTEETSTVASGAGGGADLLEDER